MSHERISPPTRLGSPGRIKAVFFDFMGTCLDWHSSAVDALPWAIPEVARSELALHWRQEFVDELHAPSRQGLALEDIDITHRWILLRTLDREPNREYSHHFRDIDRSTCLTCGEEGSSSLPASARLGSRIRATYLAGTFDMLFLSEPLGVYEPEPQAYAKALKLVRAQPDETVMVAAYAYDLRAARQLGMNAIYVSRWTFDVGGNIDVIRRENNAFLSEGDMRGRISVQVQRQTGRTLDPLAQSRLSNQRPGFSHIAPNSKATREHRTNLGSPSPNCPSYNPVTAVDGPDGRRSPSGRSLFDSVWSHPLGHRDFAVDSSQTTSVTAISRVLSKEFDNSRTK
ncbi:HAD-like domain-containing protein [Biscogniauxia sp. FL1348]|nr:HAD-like domain-containing protein [Biscogniauxia sp. FL1348]